MNNQIEEYDSQLERLKQKKDNSVINYDQYLEEVYIIKININI